MQSADHELVSLTPKFLFFSDFLALRYPLFRLILQTTDTEVWKSLDRTCG
jgi:hypothetical protein